MGREGNWREVELAMTKRGSGHVMVGSPHTFICISIVVFYGVVSCGGCRYLGRIMLDEEDAMPF